MEQTPTLKPCPFCGGEARIVDLAISLTCDGGQRVQCAKCLAAPATLGDTEAEAIAAWNHRPTEQALLEALEEFADCVDTYSGQLSRLSGYWNAKEAIEKYKAS